MRIAIPQEKRAGERRVAATPDSVKRFVGLGLEVIIESGAGAGASFSDKAYQDAGATVASSAKSAMADADIVLCVRPLDANGIGLLKKGAALVGMLEPFDHPDLLSAYAEAGIDAFAMELMPRITRAQSMDVLSSQSNLAGYRAVLEAATTFGRAFPMLMTAAGTIAPARVTIIGAGVAGLQAIATARRLGAVVSAFDVRAAAKEQVESLGATFIEVQSEENLETSGGYAREASEDYKRRQAEKLAETLKKADICISTALIPGKKAPIIVTEQMVRDMKPGSVIVDLAVERGGNCPLSKPDETIEAHGVRIVGVTNLAGQVPVDASALYARNLFNFLSPHLNKDTNAIALNWEDETVKGTALTRGGEIIHEGVKAILADATPSKKKAPARKAAAEG